MELAMQHATWIAQARQHLKEHRPQAFAHLLETGDLEQYLQDAANETGKQMQLLMRQGATWQEAWEASRGSLFPEAEPQTVPKMPQREGFKAQRELTRAMNELRMPGEKDQPE